ncbi:ABC transporter substrate-binding protein [Streptomyces sp. DSM 44917]|uniref:ABC transporter substrate-binding protein n=1 Tax=Streptomyces boetiae TaxID=3075541 RepID=A0ABU2LFP0_9ACTN|nr:ABC transporter substrate-binding protein [Streptomyces sp. DSM 44917]MDT0310275.1 ABC transporter substrate-binding protein [Streptomyces sp. DSM 44917]
MRPTRRSLLTAGGALGAGALLAACGSGFDGSQDPGDGSASGGSRPFRFTDDRDETVELDTTPERVVAFVSSAAALHDYGIRCTGVFGPSSPIDGRPNPQAGDLDLDRLTSVGEAWGEFGIEAYAELRPQLLISNMFPPPDLWFIPEEGRDEILSLAPSIGITGARVSLLEPLARYAELAEALGADLAAPAVTEARARFDAAAEAVRTAARDNPGLKLMAVTGDDQQFYVAVPDAYTDLHYFRELGVEVVQGSPSDEWGFWEFLSWENAGRHHADVILLDNRSQSPSAEDLAARPTWNRLPAVAAGQVIPWSMEERYSHAGYAPVLEALADTLSTAERLT